MTHAVTRQSTVWPLAAKKVDLTTKGVGVICGSSTVSGWPGGFEKAFEPVVNGTVAVSQRVRSSVHCWSCPPVWSARNPPAVTCTSSPFTRLSVPTRQEPKRPERAVMASVDRHTISTGAVKPGSGGGGRTGS